MGFEMLRLQKPLSLRSDFRGRQKDYLTYSVLGGLIHQGRVDWNQKTKVFTAREP
jgi:hypothetical protein